MGFHASWVHGNALTVESPERLVRVRHYGWGTDIQVRPRGPSWLHIALPTPVIVDGARSSLTRVFLMFKSEGGSIRNVHVYDGSTEVQQFNELQITGEHRLSLDSANTFNLTNPHTVIFGIGVSFYYVSDVPLDSNIPRSQLILASAGGDYDT